MGLTPCPKLGISYLPYMAENLKITANRKIPELNGLVDKVIWARNRSYLSLAVIVGGAIGLIKNGHSGFIAMTVFGGGLALVMGKKTHLNTKEVISVIENYQKQSDMASQAAIQSYFHPSQFSSQFSSKRD